MASLRYRRHVGQVAKPTPKLRVFRGKVCTACGRDERRKSDRACIHCLWWQGLDAIKNPNLYSVSQQRAYMKNAFEISRFDRHKETSRRGVHARRGRLLAAAGAFTLAQVRAILVAQGHHCAYCDERNNLHLDHCIPLARGGSNWPWNLQWLCAHHNLSKNAKTDAEYRNEIGLPPTIWISLRLWSAALLLNPDQLVPESILVVIGCDSPKI